MIASPSFTGIYSFVADEFIRLRSHARGAQLLAKIIGRRQGLISLVCIHPLELQNKRHLGVRSIPTGSITGTLGRNTDFDRNFRPLKKHLLHRWVNTYLRLDSEGWAPIIVHKYGEEYFVEDGHHRVSVAKHIGMTFIEAEVLDHSCVQAPQPACSQQHEVLRKHTEVCSASSK